MDYPKKIRELRDKLFLTQEDLAKKLDVSPITISRWETGDFQPTMKTKKLLHDLFLVENISEED